MPNIHTHTYTPSEYLYIEVEDRDIFGSKSVGKAKIPLAQVPPSRWDGAFQIFDSRGRPAGVVELGLCLEHFAMMGPGFANTQPPQPMQPLPAPLAVSIPVSLAAPTAYAPPPQQHFAPVQVR